VTRRSGQRPAQAVNLNETLWAAADKLRGSMDAAEYKHVVLGLIFLKYVSDTFVRHRTALEHLLGDPSSDEYVPDEEFRAKILESRDEYTSEGIFWLPASSRWDEIESHASASDIGRQLDRGMEAIERENPVLEGVLPKDYGRPTLDQRRLGELISLVGSIPLAAQDHGENDVLGRVYEYFLGQFASAEGKGGGEFYTPVSVVRLLVEILEPYRGRVYDPCCGSGGMFVQAAKFVDAHAGNRRDISVYGQESNPTTWKLGRMNLAIRHIDADLGGRPADTFHEDLHPDLAADFVLANPPFNLSDWGGEHLRKDRRWQYGVPPVGNANFAWLQHVISKLSARGSAGVVLANGSMSSRTAGEGDIRRALIQADLVECMIALPPQLFFNTGIPACLWFLSRDKTPRGAQRLQDRRGEILFIDARRLGVMENRVHRVLTEDDLYRLSAIHRAWRGQRGADAYADIPGLCYSASVEEVARHDFVLTPGRYVGTVVGDDPDDEPLEERIKRLSSELREAFAESKQQQEKVLEMLGRLYG
jgi:type I restriction enzyme M protein